MGERTGYAAGTPSWVDIGTDVEAAKKFYGGLFGWQTVDVDTPDDTGGYTMFAMDGKLVAGVGPQQNPGPPFWTTYISVDDVDATATKVKENGGQVVMDPMDVLTAGRMAVFTDPEGAFVSAWQPQEHAGAQVVNEANSWSWNELNTRNLDQAKAFYSAVFGWDCVTQEAGPGMTYTEIKVGGNSVGGMMDVTGRVPDMVPAHWMVYFSVDDADAAAATVQELGGSVMVPPTDIPPGRFAVVTDDKGASFAVIKLIEPSA